MIKEMGEGDQEALVERMFSRGPPQQPTEEDIENMDPQQLMQILKSQGMKEGMNQEQIDEMMQ